MATKVHMEALSPTMEEGRLVKWTKHEGDAVKSGDTLAEVETDKAVMELVARADGQLLKVLPGKRSTARGAKPLEPGARSRELGLQSRLPLPLPPGRLAPHRPHQHRCPILLRPTPRV